MATQRATLSLGQIEVPRASDLLASRIREEILDGVFAIGSPLPTERELIEHTQLSRTTVREALRTLESEGFIEMRTGRSGGPYARVPGSEGVERSVRFAILGDQTTADDLRETREALEPACARLAAKYRTDDDLERMDAAVAAITAAIERKSTDDYVQAKLEFHRAVSVASHNSLLIGFYSAIAVSIAEMIAKGVITEQLRDRAADDHPTILAAIRKQDFEAADALMRAHVLTS